MLERLERADLAAELLAGLGVSRRSLPAVLRGAATSGGGQHGAVAQSRGAGSMRRPAREDVRGSENSGRLGSTVGWRVSSRRPAPPSTARTRPSSRTSTSATSASGRIATGTRHGGDQRPAASACSHSGAAAAAAGRRRRPSPRPARARRRGRAPRARSTASSSVSPRPPAPPGTSSPKTPASDRAFQTARAAPDASGAAARTCRGQLSRQDLAYRSGQLPLIGGESEAHQRPLGSRSTRSATTLRWISLVPA